MRLLLVAADLYLASEVVMVKLDNFLFVCVTWKNDLDEWPYRTRLPPCVYILYCVCWVTYHATVYSPVLDGWLGVRIPALCCAKNIQIWHLFASESGRFVQSNILQKS